MGLKRMEEHHADPAHIRKILQAKYGMKGAGFPVTMLTAFALGCVATWILFVGLAAIPSAGEGVYLPGGGLKDALPLVVFALIMAVSMVPVAFPAPFFLIAGVLILVPAVHWVARQLVFHTRRMFHRPTVSGVRLQHLRPV